MKKTAAIFTFLLWMALAQAQVSFKTLVPQQPVVSGESFQVQYIIEEGEKAMNMRPPLFSNFRIVAGPNVYNGSVAGSNGVKSLRNSVYTLAADRPGKFIISGATVMVNGKLLRSNDALVEVLTKEEAINRFNKANGISNSDYFLRPGENGYDKIKQNLFVRLIVDKRICYVGEPVLATFKLYSRLESKSDIVKNPGFYGFTVYDMVNLADKQVTIEKLQGKIFDVHTIRKVQLYPLQAGIFTVDAMEVKNKVEFSRSDVYKKTEQEIVEGVLGTDDTETKPDGTDVFETDISTGPVTIHVVPVPDKNRPLGFDGATGRFSISAALIKNNLSKNEEGFLEIIISGKGNFIQISAPSVQWPAGIESFEPTVKDNLDKTTMPLTGNRIFRYPFVCATAGKYQLPPVNISYFDSDSKNYKMITTGMVDLVVSNEEKKKPVVEEQKTSIAGQSEKAARMAGVLVVLLVVFVLLYWIFRKKEPAPLLLFQQEQVLPSVENLLEPAYEMVSDEGNRFHSILHGIIWKFAAEQFLLSGSEMSKQILSARMSEVHINGNIIERLFKIIEQCETGMFTNASLTDDKKSILVQAKEVLESISLNGREARL